MIEVILNLLHLRFDALELLVNSLCVELRNLTYRLLYQSVDIFHQDRSLEELLVCEHLLKYLLKLILPCLCVALEDLVDLVLEEDLLKRVVMPIILQLAQPDFKFLSEKVACVQRTVT